MKNAWILDLETLAIAPNAAVIEICLMNVEHPKEKTFELLISPDFYHGFGQQPFLVDEGTIKFHKSLGQGNSYAMADMHGLTKQEAIRAQLQNMLLWLDMDSIIWCQGTDFDIPILTHLLRDFGLSPTWKYNNVRDARTLIKCMHPTPNARNPSKNAHRAAEDCAWTLAKLLEVGSYGMLPHTFLEI